MATFAAVQRNPWLGAYYQRLKATGKPPKVALIATVRKLLCGLLRREEPEALRLPRISHRACNGP